jgi:uncharacterized protein YndB with AHSA1/START domain
MLVNSDRIEKKIFLKAPRERVWRAISDPSHYGAWFGVQIDGPFVAGKEAIGRIVPTQADAEVARLQEPCRGMPWHIVVDRLEPMTLFSFRWHPYAIDPNRDYSKEPMTLVTFELADAEGGTLLTVTESGFDQIPADRRTKAIEANNGGWARQTRLIEKYLHLRGLMS